MARTRAQTAAQQGLPSLASNDQGKRPQGNQLRKSGSPKRGRFQEQHATERAERNRPSPPTISKTPSRQDSPAPAQSRGRKRKRSIEDVLVPSPDPDPKRQRTSPTRPAGNTIDELLSRKRGVDGPAESNLPRAKRLRKAKALEHASQERAISDHADFYSSQENLAASVKGEGEKLSHIIQDLLDHTPDGSLGKRQRTCLGQSIQEAGDDTKDWRNIIDFWRREGSWPKQYFEPDNSTRKDFERESEDSWLEEMERYDPTVRLLLAKKKASTSLSRKRSGSSSSTTPSQDTISASSTTPSDQKPREEKSVPYRNARYPLLLQTKGSYMGISKLGITDGSKQLIRGLLDDEQSAPQGTLFDDEIFVDTCCNLENKNEARIIQDISRLIVPSAESLALRNKNYKRLVESVNEGWNNSIPFTSTRPQPDYSVGFRRDAFTEEQLAKLSPFIGDFIAGDQSFFMATYYMYFPFLTCEVKCGVDIADRQNAHSMTLAVRGIVELFRAVKREREVHRQILAFSVSHDHCSVRIYGHYPVVDGKDTKYYRHPIRKFDFTESDGEDKWTAYRFTKNVYDTWMPAHFKNICSAIDQLPSDLNFDVPPLSEATGLSQDLGNLMQSDTSYASIPDKRDSQSSNAEQPAVTPSTSFSEPKRRKGGGPEGP